MQGFGQPAQALLRQCNITGFILHVSPYFAPALLCPTLHPGGQDWSYRGCVTNSHPSDVFPLSWPELPPCTVVGPGYAQIGVLAEPLGESLPCLAVGWGRGGGGK